MSELHELGREYGDGKLGTVERDLETFILRNRQEILRFRDQLARKNPGVTDEVACKLYILQIRTLNPVAEIRDQLDEIKREIYYRGRDEQRPVLPDEVAREWCNRHAPGWRDHRVLAIVYCFERCKERLVPLLRAEGANEGRATGAPLHG